MELSWLIRFKIAVVVAVGVVLIGFFAWPLVAPSDSFGIVSVFEGSMNFAGAVTLVVLAFLTGFIAYFLSWPYGADIGVLAVPAGLSVWAMRCGSMTALLQLNPTVAQRQELFVALRWESFFWLAVVAAGFGGVLLAQRVRPKLQSDTNKGKSDAQLNIFLNTVIALVGSGLIVQFCIGVFAQNIKVSDGRLDSLVAQPPIGQVVFAVLVSFGIAAFVIKKFLNASYIWPVVAGTLVTGFAFILYGRQEILQYLVSRHPPVFSPNAVISILPVQMVAFGALGSVAGYWLAVRYDYWRKHEME